MSPFRLRSIFVSLIEKLKFSIGQSNLLKVSIDINLPELYNDNADKLTLPIERLCLLFSQVTVNGVINIDIQKWNEHSDKITFQVSLHVSNVQRMDSKTYQDIAQLLLDIYSDNSYRLFDYDHDYNFQSSRLFTSFKIEITTAPVEHTPESTLPFEMRKILIAEDNEINAMVFTSFLDEWGCKSTVVPNGKEAVNAVKENYYDIILMDIYMPLLDGIQATRDIRKFNATIPIIALTASTLDADLNSAWDAGINDLLLKPVTSLSLFKILLKYL